MAVECLICAELDGTIDVPGGFLWEDEAAVAFHMPPLETIGRPRPYLGHLLVATRRHVAPLGDLTAAEGAAVGGVAPRLSRALTSAGGAEWVHAAVIGTGVPHFHLHLLPRYPATPHEVPWHALAEWEGGRGGGPSEIAALVARLGAAL
jgi:diadenosine tetraphosphate (Ap4A) HIT family hydrolase